MGGTAACGGAAVRDLLEPTPPPAETSLPWGGGLALFFRRAAGAREVAPAEARETVARLARLTFAAGAAFAWGLAAFLPRARMSCSLLIDAQRVSFFLRARSKSSFLDSPWRRWWLMEQDSAQG